jgi:hypothetical protein
VSTANSQRITSRVVLALVLVLLAWALSGCGSGAAGKKPAEGGSATASSTPAAKRAYGFDLAGTLAGVPGNSKRTAVKLAWFPPDGTDGLRPFLDQQQLVALTQAAMTSPQFWLLPSADSTAPIVFGDAARKAVTEHGEFTGGTIVPIVPVVHALKAGKTAPFDSLFGKPSG